MTVEARSSPPAPLRTGRVVTEALVGSAAGLGLGMLANGALGQPAFNFSLGFFAAIPVGLTLGVLGTGYLLDGDGAWWSTALGAVGGTTLGVGCALAGLAFSFTFSNPSLLYAGLALGVAMPVFWSVFGYEMTSSPSRSRSHAASGVRVAPVLAPTGDGKGAMLGFVGQL